MMHVTYSTLNKTHKTLLIITLFTFLSGLIIIIKNYAENAHYETAKLYNTAIHASSTASFNYAVDSQQGYILTYGYFDTPEPVTHPEITGTYFSVQQTTQRYTRHTETYKCGTEESPQTCTRTYYTWDYWKSNEISAPTLTLHERTYPANIFSIPYAHRVGCNVIPTKCNNNYQYEDDSFWTNEGDIRYYYTVINKDFSGSIFINTYNGEFKGATESIIKIHSEGVEELIKDANSTTGITLFIIVLIILNISLCIFIYKKNVYYA